MTAAERADYWEAGRGDDIRVVLDMMVRQVARRVEDEQRIRRPSCGSDRTTLSENSHPVDRFPPQ